MKPSKRSSLLATRTRVHRLIQRDDWLAIDTETTGLGPNAAPVEIAIVGARGEVLLDEIVRPDRLISPGATKVHGLTSKTLESAAPFSCLQRRVFRLLAERTVVAYHAAFDRTVIEGAFERLELVPPKATWYCAFEWYRDWRGFEASLRVACEVERIELTRHHRALSDALALRRLVVAMAS